MKMSTNSDDLTEHNLLKGSLIKNNLIPSEDEDDGDGKLMSLEKLRASPDLWPEKIPGMTNFIANSDTPIRTATPEWAHGLSNEDVTAVLQLSALPPSALAIEIQKMHDEVYQLGLREAQEMTRGKYLGIFNRSKKKAKN